MERDFGNGRMPMWPVWVIIGIAVCNALLYIDLGPIGTEDYTMIVPYVPDDASEGAKHTIEAIDAVVYRKGEYIGMATGMTMRPGLVLTVAHAIPEDGFDDLRVFCNGRFVKAAVLEVHRSRDIALLEADCESDRHAFYVGEIDMDEPMLLSGYDFTLDAESVPALTAVQTTRPTSLIPLVHLHSSQIMDDEENGDARHLVEAIEKDGLPPLIAFSGGVKHGFSGSPIFRRDDGSVVGIAVISSRHHYRTFIVPAITIVPVLAGHMTVLDLD